MEDLHLLFTHLDDIRESLDSLLHAFRVGEHKLSFSQYTTLLNLYQHQRTQALAMGQEAPDVSLFLPPTLGFLLQATQLITQKECDPPAELERSLELALGCLEALATTRSKQSEGPSGHEEECIRVLTSALLGDNNTNEADVRDVYHTISQLLIPTQLIIELLLERAQCFLLLEDVEGALQDCMFALSLDRYHAPAYTLRASILFKLFSSFDFHVDQLESVYPLDPCDQERIRSCMEGLFPNCQITKEDIYMHAGNRFIWKGLALKMSH